MTGIGWHRTNTITLSLAAGALAATLVSCAALGGIMFTHGNLSSIALGGIIVLFSVGIVLGCVSWLLGLMRAAQTRQWGWLATILLFGTAGTLLYSLGVSHAEATT